MKTQILFSVLILLLFLEACKEEYIPTELLLNGNVELGSNNPDSWWKKTNTDYVLAWDDEESYSPSKSLKISNQLADSTDFAFWAQTLYDNIPNGENITLKVKIKGNITGDGVSIVIRGDDDSWYTGGDAEQSATTQFNTHIVGTFDWTEYSLTMENVGEEITVLNVYLILLPNTVGEVYFDDISLSY